jgi:CubicO group peptidase (beta-lactamase class C family)
MIDPRLLPSRPLLTLLLATVLAVVPATLHAQAVATPRAGTAATAHVFPGAEWERIAPDRVGWSDTGLDAVRQKLESLSTTSLMAIVGGRVFFEYGDTEVVSYLASVRKSVLSMMYGIYVDRGVIRLDKTLEELGIDDRQGLLPHEKQATIAHLLAARSGIFHPASNSGDDLASAPPRGSQAPGTYYLYSNWDFNALGTIFEQETGRNIYDALEEEIVRPLGFRDFDRQSHRRSGNAETSMHLAYHMNFSTRDMARIGYVMLREGNWAGRQVIPEAWVRESTRAITPRAEMNPARRRSAEFGYGYLWWVFDNPSLGPDYEGAYIGLGAVGQHILVMPKLDLVVVHKTRQGQGGSVSHGQFLEVADLLLKARARQAAQAAAARPAGELTAAGS